MSKERAEATVTTRYFPDGHIEVDIKNFERLTPRKIERGTGRANEEWQKLRAIAIGKKRRADARAARERAEQETQEEQPNA
jgi:hypothetical protein